MDNNDIICTDGVYGLFDEDRHLKPHRKPNNRPLSDKKQHENDQITEFRGDIERKFGHLVNKFGILKKRFKHGEQVFNLECRICMCTIIIFISIIKHYFCHYYNFKVLLWQMQNYMAN